jgi:2-polyprenyl-3-methyl-5-hydroxy-6-metoxy-1,4-benzoquinol methylase
MVAELVVTSAAADKVMFKHMDPCSMAPDLGEYEVVIINSVLERCPSPKGVLSRMGGTKGLVKPGGMVYPFVPFFCTCHA